MGESESFKRSAGVSTVRQILRLIHDKVAAGKATLKQVGNYKSLADKSGRRVVPSLLDFFKNRVSSAVGLSDLANYFVFECSLPAARRLSDIIDRFDSRQSPVFSPKVPVLSEPGERPVSPFMMDLKRFLNKDSNLHHLVDHANKLSVGGLAISMIIVLPLPPPSDNPVETEHVKRGVLIHETTHAMMNQRRLDVPSQMPNASRGLERRSKTRNEDMANHAMILYLHDHTESFNAAARAIRIMTSHLDSYICELPHTESDFNDLVVPRFGSAAFLEGDNSLHVVVNPLWQALLNDPDKALRCPVHSRPMFYEGPKWVYVSRSNSSDEHRRYLLRMLLDAYSREVRTAYLEKSFQLNLAGDIYQKLSHIGAYSINGATSDIGEPAINASIALGPNRDSFLRCEYVIAGRLAGLDTPSRCGVYKDYIESLSSLGTQASSYVWRVIFPADTPDEVVKAWKIAFASL